MQQPGVQEANYGRLLDGAADVLPGYRLDMVEIADASVVALSGEAVHPIACFTGDRSDSVSGMRFEVSVEELAASDAYEVDAYRRVSAALQSGVTAFVYVAAEDGPE